VADENYPDRAGERAEEKVGACPRQVRGILPHEYFRADHEQKGCRQAEQNHAEQGCNKRLRSRTTLILARLPYTQRPLRPAILQGLLLQIPNRFATAWIRTELTRECLAQDLLDLGRGCFLVRMAVLHR